MTDEIDDWSCHQYGYHVKTTRHTAAQCGERSQTLTAEKPRVKVFTRTEREFWRESEQRWVRHINMVFWGRNKDEPTRWRHRTVTETTSYGEWEDGKA